ncbi:MAG TPA: acetyl-CoA carboxylase biotin carboxyl carrier protein [Bacillota bacterium]|nr:acetyl-CoA carboxylase biotin carboxyl carrier protein [Bacillota bacterium]
MLKVDEIRELIELIDESSINEFSYETENATIKLKKATEKIVETVAQTEAPQSQQVISQPAVTEQRQEENAAVNNEQADETDTQANGDYEIVSPMVGTVYRASSPENEPYVKNGTVISEGSIVCIVEAMKLFNEIESEVDGEIVEVLVKDGELVEYGQPLFRVKKS